MEKNKKFAYPERQVLSKENYKKFLEAQENTKKLINHIEDEINSAKKERRLYEDGIKVLESKKNPSNEVIKGINDYRLNIQIISKAIDTEMLLQADLIKKYKILEKTVVCEE